MNKADYPALYRAASAASDRAQKGVIRCHKTSVICLVIAVIAAADGLTSRWLAVISAIFFLASLGAFFYGKHQKLQASWYKARALAESIKTATWRLIMAADPFSSAREDLNLAHFRGLLNELLEENRGMGAQLSGEWASEDQITVRIKEVIRLPFTQKKQLYLEERIQDQRRWYAKKSMDNRTSASIFLRLIIGAYAIALVLLMVRIANPEIPFLPIDVVAVIASGLIGWTEIKRFDELASAYGLTAHEVGIIQTRYDAVATPQDLSSFVSDAENAFSREHTQWAARRDH